MSAVFRVVELMLMLMLITEYRRGQGLKGENCTGMWENVSPRHHTAMA